MLNELTIAQATKGLREKKFSSLDLTNACIDAIEKKDKDFNAFITCDFEGARKSAKKIDLKLSKGENLPVLAGIPVGIKDIINTKGVKTTCASPFLQDFVPPYDATVVKKLRENGMVMLGKNNLDEFACGSSTEHSFFGFTRNPYDLERVAGGSSGGGATATATDMCLYSIGTDTGSSIRQPAAFCGVYGLKVTYGRVSRYGITSMASSWDSVGPIAKSVEDVALIMNVISGKDEKDSTTSFEEVPDYTQFLNQDIKGMKIGLPKQYFAKGIDKEIVNRVKQEVLKLEKAGAEVKEVDLPLTKYTLAVYYVSMPAELSANLERFDGIRYGKKPSKKPKDLVDYYFEARGEGFGDEIKRRIMIGTYVLSAGYYDAYYKKAQKVRTLIINEFNKVFEDVDVLIAPVTPTLPFKAGELVNDPLAMYMADVLTVPANSAGIPGLACPIGLSESGLPISLQVMAPQFEEGRCIKIASALSLD